MNKAMAKRWQKLGNWFEEAHANWQHRYENYIRPYELGFGAICAAIRYSFPPHTQLKMMEQMIMYHKPTHSIWLTINKENALRRAMFCYLMAEVCLD